MINIRRLAICLLVAAGFAEARGAPPRVLLQGSAAAEVGDGSGGRKRLSILRMPDGSFAFYDRSAPQAGPLTLPDRAGQTHTLLPALPEEIRNSQAVKDSGVLANTQVILTPGNRVVGAIVRSERFDRKTAAKVGLPLYLDVWVQCASLTQAEQAKMIWRGYNGSQMEFQQLRSGRILVPYGSFQPHATPVPPHGRHKTIIQLSDDQGQTWQESESQLISPCYAGFNGLNEGACEPAIEQLKDGRVWMLMRTQAGFLYESFSGDDGATWRPATASRFYTSTGPPNIMRHQNGWLVVCWNNCEMPPRHQGQGVYGGRDALHIAVSDDEGLTWRGFREIYLDHRRNDNPARSGDRGTAYPLGAYTEDGQLVVVAGQGHGGRNPILIDPEWIVETDTQSDFSDGLQQWSVYKHHGLAKRWWRARAVGCDLVANPTDANSRSLHLRKPDSLPADGAVWNFPNGWRGALETRIMFRPGSSGGTISLNDRFFDPANDFGEDLAVFQVRLQADGRIGNARLVPDKWHQVKLLWDLSEARCEVFVDQQLAGLVPLRNKTLNGISYVRFRSAAQEIDTAGFLVDRVAASIDDPYAPRCSARQRLDQERRYVQKVVPHWQ